MARLGSKGGTGSMSYTDSGLSASTQYCYRVRVYNATGDSYSNQICGQTDAPPPPPADLAFNGSMYIVDAATGGSTYYPKAGRAIYVVWYICNVGGSNAGPFDVQVQRDGFVEGYISVSSLAVGACGYQHIYYQYGLSAGTHYWYVNLDWGNRVTEIHESNNTNYLSIQVQQ